MNPPKPIPDVTMPVTKPFFPGRWLQDASNAVGYKKPLPSPKLMEKRNMKDLASVEREDRYVPNIRMNPPMRVVLK